MPEWQRKSAGITPVVFRDLPLWRQQRPLVFPVLACHRAYVTTGDEIRAARERARMSQQELADKLEVSLRTVGNWERGETVPRNRLAAINELLGIGAGPEQLTYDDVKTLGSRLNNIERQINQIWERLERTQAESGRLDGDELARRRDRQLAAADDYLSGRTEGAARKSTDKNTPQDDEGETE